MNEEKGARSKSPREVYGKQIVVDRYSTIPPRHLPARKDRGVSAIPVCGIHVVARRCSFVPEYPDISRETAGNLQVTLQPGGPRFLPNVPERRH